jgi:hypothetical protein
VRFRLRAYPMTVATCIEVEGDAVLDARRNAQAVTPAPHRFQGPFGGHELLGGRATEIPRKFGRDIDEAASFGGALSGREDVLLAAGAVLI